MATSKKEWLKKLIILPDNPNKEIALKEIVDEMMSENAVNKMHDSVLEMHKKHGVAEGNLFITHIGQTENGKAFSVSLEISDSFIIFDN